MKLGTSGGALILVLGLASCSLFETKVTRDLRAVWSPDGASLLVVVSEYTTLNPEEIYYNATSGTNWRVKLDVADGRASDPLATRQPLDDFDENLAMGGVAQYEPVYWFPDSRVVVFGGRTSSVRYIDRKTTWKPLAEPTQLAAALGSVNEVESSLTPSRVAADLELLDLVPSPDGSRVAGLYAISYLYGPEIGGEFYEYRVIAFWDVATQALLNATRVTPEVWHTLRSVDPYPELTGEDQNYVTLSWQPNGSGVYAYVFAGSDGSQLIGTPPEHPTVPSLIAFVPVTGPAVTAAQVPSRPVATASGPVSPSGVGYFLVVDGNKTSLQSQVLPGWVSFDQIPLVSFTTWSAHASDYNF